MKVLVLLPFLVSLVVSVPQGLTINVDLNEDWEAFKTVFNKRYVGVTEISRRLIWEQNLKYIQQHNIEHDLGKHTYTLGVNQFADMTNEEFKKLYLSSTLPKVNASSRFLPPLNVNELPDSVDWRTKGYVTPVKDQGQCGSCWSFSTTGSLEGQTFRKTGRLLSLSEQQLVDCSGAYGNNGCGGGLMDNAFRYIEKYGIESEATYPYTAQDGHCRYAQAQVVASCTGFQDIQQGSESDLKNAVATVGPVSVAIDAGHLSFQLYKSGVYNEPQCSSINLDHGVLAVGYGSSNGQNYWLVKNSWGTGWGMSGYIWMSKDRNNQCGIATMASYPTV